MAERRPVAGAACYLEDLSGGPVGVDAGAEGTAKDGGGQEGVQVLALELVEVVGERVGAVTQVAAGVAQNVGVSQRGRGIVGLGDLAGGGRDGTARRMVHDGARRQGGRGSAGGYGSSQGVGGGQIPLLRLGGLGADGRAVVGGAAGVAILGFRVRGIVFLVERA